MALYDYLCQSCQHAFEELRSSSDKDPVQCPMCKGTQVQKQISAFRVAGRGDLRESTLHGCHDANVAVPGEKKGHNHGSGGGCGQCG